MRPTGFTLALAFAPLGLLACNAYRLDPPPGFAQARTYDTGVHMKANDNVGLRVDVFENVKGGTLAFWARDMVEKLGARDYTLESQSAARSANGVAGTRFDFHYTPVGHPDQPRFYSVVLFVTDEHRFVLQLAGKQMHRARYTAQVDGIVGELKVRGCRVGSQTCRGPQPDRLSTTTTPPPDKPTSAPPPKPTDDAPTVVPGANAPSGANQTQTSNP